MSPSNTSIDALFAGARSAKVVAGPGFPGGELLTVRAHQIRLAVRCERPEESQVLAAEHPARRFEVVGDRCVDRSVHQSR